MHETDLSRNKPVPHGCLRHEQANQVVSEKVDSYFPDYHLWRAVTEHIHAHCGFQNCENKPRCSTVPGRAIQSLSYSLSFHAVVLLPVFFSHCAAGDCNWKQGLLSRQPDPVSAFYLAGQLAGLRKQDIDSSFSDLVARVEHAVAKVDALAADVGMSVPTFEPIIARLRKQAKLL